MEIGYRVQGGRIYGPYGFTGYSITKSHRIIGPRGYTRHWIYGKHIYEAGAGNTGYWFEANRLCGPDAKLPWERRGAKKKEKDKETERITFC